MDERPKWKQPRRSRRRNASSMGDIFATSINVEDPQKIRPKLPSLDPVSTRNICNANDFLPFIKSTRCHASMLGWMRGLRSPTRIRLPMYESMLSRI